MRLSELVGHPIVTTTGAEEIGRVTTAVIEPDAHRIVALRVGDDRVLPLDGVTAIGHDAVTVPAKDAVRFPSTDAEVRWIEHDLDLSNRRVLSDEGNALGQIDDVEFDPSSGEIEAVVLSGRRLAGDDLIGVGRYAVVLRDPRHTG